MVGANFAVVVDLPGELRIRDLGPWDRRMTVTNDVERVVAALAVQGYLHPGRRLFYYDSDGRLDEILVKDGKFAGFQPGPDVMVTVKADPPVTVKTIVVEFLRTHGYEGLFNADAECACDLDDPMQCAGEMDCEECQAGYRQHHERLTPEAREVCGGEGSICESLSEDPAGECGCIGANKPPEATK